MSQESVLETQSLEKWFGGVRAVAGVDFKMRRGELRCLIGPNGAGKSTFFKLVTGQLRASGGRIIFDGQEITGRAPHTIGRLGIGIKNQVPSVFEGLSVAENLWLAARLRHSTTGARVAVHEMIYRLNLGNVAKQTVGTLAHGMRQWVDIGMVMAQRPKLILAVHAAQPRPAPPARLRSGGRPQCGPRRAGPSAGLRADLWRS